MPGNEQYPGAKRRPGSKKGPTKGSGGQRRKGLEGKGPTPRAENRVGHPKARAKARAESRAAQPTRAKQLEKIKRRFDVPEGHEILCGRNAVAEAAYASVPITRVFMAVSAQSDERLGAVVRRAALLGAPVLETTKLDLDALTDSATHQGVAIEVPAYEYTTARDLLERARALGRTPLLVALDQVTDPHNLGAVLRSAGAFGADGVIIPERRSVGVNATVWKVSAGAAARVRVARETNLVRTLEQLKKEGCFVVGLDGSGSTDIEDLTLADSPLVLVTGAEGAGLSRLVRETCDVLASVPISRSVESLNAAVATGISLYEGRPQLIEVLMTRQVHSLQRLAHLWTDRAVVVGEGGRRSQKTLQLGPCGYGGSHLGCRLRPRSRQRLIRRRAHGTHRSVSEPWGLLPSIFRTNHSPSRTWLDSLLRWYRSTR